MRSRKGNGIEGTPRKPSGAWFDGPSTRCTCAGWMRLFSPQMYLPGRSCARSAFDAKVAGAKRVGSGTSGWTISTTDYFETSLGPADRSYQTLSGGLAPYPSRHCKRGRTLPEWGLGLGSSLEQSRVCGQTRLPAIQRFDSPNEKTRFEGRGDFVYRRSVRRPHGPSVFSCDPRKEGTVCHPDEARARVRPHTRRAMGSEAYGSTPHRSSPRSARARRGVATHLPLESRRGDPLVRRDDAPLRSPPAPSRSRSRDQPDRARNIAFVPAPQPMSRTRARGRIHFSRTPRWIQPYGLRREPRQVPVRSTGIGLSPSPTVLGRELRSLYGHGHSEDVWDLSLIIRFGHLQGSRTKYVWAGKGGNL